MVLLLSCRADVDNFAVLENEEVVLFGESFEPLNGLFAKVANNIDMSFEDSDVEAEIYRDEPALAKLWMGTVWVCYYLCIAADSPCSLCWRR